MESNFSNLIEKHSDGLPKGVGYLSKDFNSNAFGEYL